MFALTADLSYFVSIARPQNRQVTRHSLHGRLSGEVSSYLTLRPGVDTTTSSDNWSAGCMTDWLRWRRTALLCHRTP